MQHGTYKLIIKFDIFLKEEQAVSSECEQENY